MFPLQSRASRREVIWGGVLLLIPFLGWLLNMGHRIAMTHRMQQGQSAWPAWRGYGSLVRHGVITFVGMVEYFSPAVACGFIGWRIHSGSLLVIAAILWIVAMMAVPGYMTHYCLSLDAREIFNPFRALRRVFEGGQAYWHAWLIVLAALGLSFLGLLAFGVGFLFTSVWFWQVAGFCFATVFSQRFDLHATTEAGLRPRVFPNR